MYAVHCKVHTVLCMVPRTVTDERVYQIRPTDAARIIGNYARILPNID